MDRFLARQPILTSEKHIFGYEILSRLGPENYFRAPEGEAIHVNAMDELFLMGLKQMTNGLPAFVNCSREFLLRDYLELLPREFVVGEILETVKPAEDIVAACRRMKDKGYRIALDDYQDSPEMECLVDLADFIKIDFLATSLGEQARLGEQFQRLKIPLVAEKVETLEQFQRGIQMGYELFQGYFFCRPQMMERRGMAANKLIYLRLIETLARPNFDMRTVIGMLKQEMSLSYRLMRYLNSPAYSMCVEVHSIPHALSLLGENATRKWLSLVCLSALGGDESFETIKIALIRAILRIAGGRSGHAQGQRGFVSGGTSLSNGRAAGHAHEGSLGQPAAGEGCDQRVDRAAKPAASDFRCGAGLRIWNLGTANRVRQSYSHQRKSSTEFVFARGDLGGSHF